jgi:hypothetical protein
MQYNKILREQTTTGINTEDLPEDDDHRQDVMGAGTVSFAM